MADLLGNAAVAAFAVDPAQRIIFWNAEAEKLTNCAASGTLGRPCWEVLAGRDQRGRRFCREGCKLVLRANFDGRVAPVHLLTGAGDGRECWVAVLTLVLPSPRGERVTLFHLLQDIDHMKRAEGFASRVITAVAQLPPGFGETAGPLPSGSKPREAAAVNQYQQKLRELGIRADKRLSKELTAREQEVLDLLIHGADTAAIAEKLFISQATVRNHVQRILCKLGVHSRLEAAIAAFAIHGY